MKILKKFLGHLRSSFYLDLRSLALMRIFLGSAILYDLFYTRHLLQMFFSDEGFLSRIQYMQMFGKAWNHSLMFISGHPHFVTAFFIVFALICLLFILGFHTRLMTILLYIFLVSIHNRNPGGLNGGDDLVRVVMVILIFLPLGHYYSLDHALGRIRKPKEFQYASLWGLTLIVQISIMYIASAHFKDHPIWREEYSALYYALHLDAFTRTPGYILRNFPNIMKISTFFTIWSEMFLPYVLILTTFHKKLIWIRYIPIVIFSAFHLGIDFFMNVGIFPFYAIAIWLGLLPTSFWNFLGRKINTEERKGLTLYFDGGCRFCEKLVLIIKEFFLIGETKTIFTQANPQINNIMLKKNTWVVKNSQGQVFTHFAGIIEMTRHIPFFGWAHRLLALKPIALLGNFGYKLVANNRSTMSWLTAVLPLKKQEKKSYRSHFLYDALAILWIYLLLHWPMADLKIQPWYHSNWTWHTNRYMNTYQYWGLFSPYPKRNNVWIQIIGHLSDKSKVNLPQMNRDTEPNWPKKLNTHYYNKTWRKFILRLESSKKYRTLVTKYYCRDWNYRHRRISKHLLKSVEVIVHDEMLYLNYKRGPRKSKMVHKEFCY
jgi:predicted DCC family thiol-disulfide oxidoreductase YuxK